MDYELTRFELEEADELCHGNWIEIQRLRKHIDLLEKLLREHGMNFHKFLKENNPISFLAVFYCMKPECSTGRKGR